MGVFSQTAQWASNLAGRARTFVIAFLTVHPRHGPRAARLPQLHYANHLKALLQSAATSP